MSLTDQLTGLRNRRFFLQHVDADVGMSLRRYDDSLHKVRPDGLFARLMHHLEQALAAGEATLVSSLEHPALPAGPKKHRLGLAADQITA